MSMDQLKMSVSVRKKIFSGAWAVERSTFLSEGFNGPGMDGWMSIDVLSVFAKILVRADFASHHIL